MYCVIHVSYGFGIQSAFEEDQKLSSKSYMNFVKLGISFYWFILI